MQKVRTFLWYDNEAEQAVQRYVSLVPDSRIVQIDRFGADPAVPGSGNVVIDFELGGVGYLALEAGPQFHFTEAVSIMVDCADQAEVDRLWDGLLAGGGAPSMCGWLKDPWGLSWQIVPHVLMELQRDPDPARAGRVNAAMLTMSKLDIAALVAAADAA